MPKTFYTDHDIEDLVKRGVQSLIVDDDVVLTDLAYEKARRLGLELLRQNDKPPAAPERPYIAKPRNVPPQHSQTAERVKPGPPAAPPAAPVRGPVGGDDLHTRVRDAVIARLGDSVDPKLLDTIIQRVLKSISTS
jgi:hypothetical protein